MEKNKPELGNNFDISADSAPITVRAHWSSHLVFAILLAILPVLATYAAFTKTEHNNVPLLIFCFGFFLLPQLWFRSQYFTVYSDRLVYRNVFKKEIAWNQIGRAEFRSGVMDRRLNHQLDGFYQLQLYAPHTRKKPLLIINAKPFSVEGLALLAGAIMRYAPDAKVDETIVALSQRNIQPVLKDAMRQIWPAFLAILLLFLALAIFRGLRLF